jgi:hypothetical protein
MSSLKYLVGLVAFIILYTVTIATAGGTDEPRFKAKCTDRAGTTFEVRNLVFNYCYNYPSSAWTNTWLQDKDNPCHFMPFNQDGFMVTINFDAIQTIEFVDDPPSGITYSWKPLVKVTMRDDKAIKGLWGDYGEFGHELRGEAELGRFALAVEKVKKVEFEHTGEYVVKRPSSKKPKYGSEYTFTVRTWDNKELVIGNGFLFKLHRGHYYRDEDVTTSFGLKVGESDQKVSFDKIKSLVFKEKDKPDAELITTDSGKSVKVSVIGNGLYLGGILEPFGSGWIDLTKVATIHIAK